MARGVYVGVPEFEKVTLPTGYTQVSHIQSSGEQYVNTGVVLTNAVFDIEVKATYKGDVNSSDLFALLGFMKSASETTPRMGIMAYKKRFHCGVDSTEDSGVTLDNKAHIFRYVADGSKESLYIDGELTTTNSVSNSAMVNNTLSIYLFGRNEANSLGKGGSWEVSYVKMNVGGALVRNYFSCVNANGTAGLYDLVEGKFCGNNGTGTFTAGSSEPKSIARKVKQMYVGVPSVKVKNLIVDGSFEDYSTNWTQNTTMTQMLKPYSNSMHGVNSLYLNINKVDQLYTHTETQIPLTTNHKYYWCIHALLTKVPTGNLTIMKLSSVEPYELAVSDTLELNTWHRISCISTATATVNTTGLQIGHIDRESTNISVYLDGAMLIDLTETFGSGNEPTKEWCDNNLEFVYESAIVENSTLAPKARRVKKAYVGVGGVARPFFGEYEFSYYGKITNLRTGRSRCKGLTLGDFAIIAGGASSSSVGLLVETYDKSLTKVNRTNLSVSMTDPSGATVGNYALFAGNGITVNAYDKSMTRSIPMDMNTARNYPCGVSVGDYALFGAGTNNSYVSSIDAYDSSLTRTNPTSLSYGRQNCFGVTVGDYGVFAGGSDSSQTYNKVESYNTSLTRQTRTNLSFKLVAGGATSNGEYALFGGGFLTEYTNVVNAYNKSMTRSIPTAMTIKRSYVGATSVNGYNIFAGGQSPDDSSGYTNTVEVYDKSLTKITADALNSGRRFICGVTLGNYALFAGGYTSSHFNTVDAYVVQ